MTKKHYEAIALIMHTFWMRCSTAKLVKEHKALCLELSKYFAQTNPLFQSEKFLLACGVRFDKCPECSKNIDPEYMCCYSKDCDYFA